MYAIYFVGSIISASVKICSLLYPKFYIFQGDTAFNEQHARGEARRRASALFQCSQCSMNTSPFVLELKKDRFS